MRILYSSTTADCFCIMGHVWNYLTPRMELFDFSTHFNFGLGRETVFIVQLPTFAQLGFRNYYSEVFIHVINLIAKWPIAFRKLLEQNCSVNLSGKCGKGIELDCWVESRIVKPTKKFCQDTQL